MQLLSFWVYRIYYLNANSRCRKNISGTCFCQIFSHTLCLWYSNINYTTKWNLHFNLQLPIFSASWNYFCFSSATLALFLSLTHFTPNFMVLASLFFSYKSILCWYTHSPHFSSYLQTTPQATISFLSSRAHSSISISVYDNYWYLAYTNPTRSSHLLKFTILAWLSTW